MLTKYEFDPYLDMAAYRGQRVERFRWAWVYGPTNEVLGWLTPQYGPQLSHDTTSSIKRRLTLSLGKTDTASIDPLTDRILPYFILNGVTWPLGRYVFSDPTLLKTSNGDFGSYTLLDEGFIIEQELDAGYSSTQACDTAIFDLVSGLPLQRVLLEASPYRAVGSFSVGTNRGQALDAYATQGDYFPYWMDHAGDMRMIRTIDPARVVPDFDWDAGNKVRRDSVNLTNDIITAPNRFVVIGNSGESSTEPAIGKYDVPPSAPHSIARRGFAIQDTRQLEVNNAAQAQVMARNVGIRQTVYERMSVSTTIDPRHDSYNVVHFQGSNWLELRWSIECTPGGTMTHELRKAYM